MKKTTIIILISVAVLLGIVCGVVVSILDDHRLEQAQINEIKKVNELIESNIINQNLVNNDIIATNSSDIKLSPKAMIYFEKHYEECGHTIIEKEEIEEEEVNKTEDYFKDAYSDWKIESFDSNEVRLYKEMPGICNKHYLITIKDEHIAVYTVDMDGNTTLKEVTDIPIQYLPETDIGLLEQGIKANGDNELIRKLEDFE